MDELAAVQCFRLWSGVGKARKNCFWLAARATSSVISKSASRSATNIVAHAPLSSHTAHNSAVTRPCQVPRRDRGASNRLNTGELPMPPHPSLDTSRRKLLPHASSCRATSRTTAPHSMYAKVLSPNVNSTRRPRLDSTIGQTSISLRFQQIQKLGLNTSTIQESGDPVKGSKPPKRDD
jgi:hypothetical protein